MITKYGIIETVERVVKRAADPSGYTALINMGLADLAFEAVVLRHPTIFSTNAVTHSRERLDAIGKESETT